MEGVDLGFVKALKAAEDAASAKKSAENLAAAKETYKEGSGQSYVNDQVTTLDKFVRQNISGPLSEQVSDLTDFIAKHPLVGFLDSTIGKVFGGHPGQTYWESKLPAPTSEYYDAYVKANPRPVTDQFTYQMTPSEKNSQLPHAFIDGQPNTDVQKQIAALTGGKAPSSTVYSSPGVVDVQATAALANSEGNQSNNNNVTTLSNNTRLAGEEGRYTNSTPQRGSNTAAYDSNYNRAIPSTATLAANPSMTAQAAPLAGAITSPSAFNSVATSYGNTNNAGRQWTSGAMKTNNGGGYTNTALAPLDTTENSTSLNDLYQEVFGRNVGQPGKDAYQSSLDDKSLSTDRLRDILYDSAEYKDAQNAEKNNLAELERNRVLTEQAKQARAAEAAATNNALYPTLTVASPATPATAPLGDNTLSASRNKINEYYQTHFGRDIGDAAYEHYAPILATGVHENGQTGLGYNWFDSHLSKSGEAATHLAKKAAAAAATTAGAA